MKLLKDRLTELRSNVINLEQWSVVSAKVIDDLNLEFEDSQTIDDTENSYTNQIRTGLDRLKNIVGLTHDPEILSILLDSWLESEELEDVEHTAVESVTGRLEDSEAPNNESAIGPSNSEPSDNPTRGKTNNEDSLTTVE
jgi:hypothetical protein